MKVTFLVQSAHKMGGTERSAISQANALVAAGHEVRILSVVKAAEEPVFAIDDRVAGRPPGRPHRQIATTRSCTRRPSLLVPERWDKQFSALTDVGLEQGLRGLSTDVLVTVTPALLACALELAPDSVVVVHQEHRSSSQRTSGMEPLLVNAPARRRGRAPHPEHRGLAARPARTGRARDRGHAEPAAAGVRAALAARLADDRRAGPAGDGEAVHQAGAGVRATSPTELPGWRLRILGQGHQRPHLVRETRKRGLWDRVELPGSTTDMRSEWARASISALTSRAEGFPLGLQEAMAAGVPCVSFDCASGPREIVRHEVNGLLVAPESIAGMSAALLRLGTDDDLRHRLGAGALDSAAAWDADLLAGRWVEIFEGAIARRAGRPRYAARSAAPPTGTARRRRRTTRPASRPQRPGTPRSSLAVAAARSASDEWLVVPPHETGTPVVVLPMAARHRFLQELAAADVPSYLSLRDPAANGWHERRARSPCWPPTCSAAGRRWSRSSPGPWRPATGRAMPRSSARAARSRWSSGRRASRASSWRRPATATHSGSPAGR